VRWSDRFEDPIPLPNRRQFFTLKDAGAYSTRRATMTDHAPDFILYAAGHRLIGPRGALIRWCRYRAPMIRAARQGASLPVLRNRFDVRKHWPDDAPEGAGAAADSMWCEFCATLDPVSRALAMSLDDLDRGERVAADQRAIIEAWLREFGDRAVSASDLADVRTATYEAICRATGKDAASAREAAWVARRMVGVSIVGCDWRVVAAPWDRYRKVFRWRLERMSTDQVS
jgi:hypothetical protein